MPIINTLFSSMTRHDDNTRADNPDLGRDDEFQRQNRNSSTCKKTKPKTKENEYVHSGQNLVWQPHPFAFTCKSHWLVHEIMQSIQIADTCEISVLLIFTDQKTPHPQTENSFTHRERSQNVPSLTDIACESQWDPHHIRCKDIIFCVRTC